MKRILHVTSSLKMGGAEMMLADMVRYFHARGYVQYVVYMHDGPVRHAIERYAKTGRVRGLCVQHDPWVIVRLVRIIRSFCPDVIHSQLWAANVWARCAAYLTCKPVINVLHTPFSAEGKDSYLRNILDRYSFHLATRIVVVSSSVHEVFASRDMVHKNKIEQIDNAVDSARIRREAHAAGITRASLGLHDTDIIFGAVGRLVPLKNYHVLIDAFAQCAAHNSSFKLVLIGDGPCAADVRNQIVQRGMQDQILLLGAVRAVDYYPLFDYFVHPSRVEGLSMALLEAQSFGLPLIVASDNGVHPLVETQDDGLIIDADNSDALAWAMRHMAAGNGVQKRAGGISKKCRFADSMGRYEKVFSRCAKE